MRAVLRTVLLSALAATLIFGCREDVNGVSGAGLDVSAVGADTGSGSGPGGENDPGPRPDLGEPPAGDLPGGWDLSWFELPQPSDGQRGDGSEDVHEGPVDCTGDVLPTPCPCNEDDDCASGICLAVEGPRICLDACVSDCPVGFACVGVQTAPDMRFLCLPRFARLCQPCTEHVACQTLGEPGIALCLDHGDEGSFCGASCVATEQCPRGYSCEKYPRGDGVMVGQCVPDGGECRCNETGVALAMSTVCSLTNSLGSCSGTRACGPEGLGACDAKTPSSEVCDLEDNDCNGKVDDISGGPVCHVTNAFGACPGERSCVGGVQECIGAPPEPEVCNGLDDNCNDEVDEGHPDTDSDGMADCVDLDADGDLIPDDQDNCPRVYNPEQVDVDGDGIGDECDADGDGDGYADGFDCGPDDPTVNPDAEEVCNGKDDDCDGRVDNVGDACADDVACTFDYCEPLSGACGHAPNDVTCLDSDPCTRDRCDPMGGCVHEWQTGVACDDGDRCTVDDTCMAGGCRGTPLAECCQEDHHCDDLNACTADRCHGGQCVHTNMPSTAPCDDSNSCTTGDHCEGGVCVGGFDPCNDGDPCTVDGCLGGTCTHQVAPDGSVACNDLDPCTTNDRCVAGVCRGETTLGCCIEDKDCDDDDACTADICGANSKCRHEPVPGSPPCDDGDACTTGDTCHSGACIGTPQPCDDGDPCTLDGCAAGSCTHTAVPDGTVVCNDNDPCTAGDRCTGGSCRGVTLPSCCRLDEDCDDQNLCTDDVCGADNTCTHAPVTLPTSCDDGDPCTTGDACQAGACAGVLDACDDGNPCTVDTCVDGQCTHQNVADTTSCPPSGTCTTPGQCIGGICRNDPSCADTDNDGTPDAADCAPLDPDRHPGAPEICNGLDDDCDGQGEIGMLCSYVLGGNRSLDMGFSIIQRFEVENIGPGGSGTTSGQGGEARQSFSATAGVSSLRIRGYARNDGCYSASQIWLGITDGEEILSSYMLADAVPYTCGAGSGGLFQTVSITVPALFPQ